MWRGLLRTARWSVVPVALCAVAASAQEERMHRPGTGEAIIYRDSMYRGPAVNVRQPNPNLGLAWPVTSIRVKSGSWQVCSRPNYTGTCITISSDQPGFAGRLGPRSALQSMRPIAGGGGGGGGDWGGDWGGDRGRSLKGMAAEFFPTPMARGARVLACAHGAAAAGCAATTADQFCRAAGWTASAREAMETMNRRVYLADVLCTRTGR